MVWSSLGLLSPPSFRGAGKLVLWDPHFFCMIFLHEQLVLHMLLFIRWLNLGLLEIALAFVFPILGMVDRLYFSRFVLFEEDV